MTEYDRQLAKALLDNAVLASGKSFYGGFDTVQDLDLYKHVGFEEKSLWLASYHRMGPPRCGGWRSLTHVTEESEFEFTDTFSDPEEVYFVTGQVTCKCGLIDNESIFYRGTMSELIRKVTAEPEDRNYLA